MNNWTTFGIANNCIFWGRVSLGLTFRLRCVMVGISYDPNVEAFHVFVIFLRFVVFVGDHEWKQIK